MKVGDTVKFKKPQKDKRKEAKEFANQYMKNVTENQIKVMCPECNMTTTIYPEHLDRSYCEKCNVLLKKVENSKTNDAELKKGDLVRFRRVVDPNDDKIVMRLLENPDGGRVLVESLIWDELNPTRVLPTSELIKDSETKDVIKNNK
jgi:ribosomal protein S27AE